MNSLADRPWPTDTREMSAVYQLVEDLKMDDEPFGVQFEGSEEVLSTVDELATISPVVRSLIFAMCDNATIPQDLRMRLMDSAAQGLAARRALLSPLPSLLSYERVEANMDLSQVSQALDVSEGDAARLENGELGIRSLTAIQISKWIKLLNVNPAAATDSLRRSLEAGASPALARAAGASNRAEVQLSDADESLLAEVRGLLG